MVGKELARLGRINAELLRQRRDHGRTQGLGNLVGRDRLIFSVADPRRNCFAQPALRQLSSQSLQAINTVLPEEIGQVL